jgi:PIN domain nuclease of toxin-antitoxin system
MEDETRVREGSLSLGDALTLAVAHRLKARAVTFDAAWAHFPTLTFPLIDPGRIPD